MVCDGFEHSQRVELVVDTLNVPAGATGTVIEIDRVRHTANIDFDLFGLVLNVDCHSIVSIGEPPFKTFPEAGA